MAKKTSRKTIVRSIFDFIFLGIGVKVLGFLRTILMAQKFGISADTDAFYFVQALIFALAFVAGKAFQIVMVPVLNKAETRHGKEGKKFTLNNLLNVILLISASLCLVTYIWARPLMDALLTGDQDPAYVNLVVHLFRMGLPIIFFYNAASTLRSYLQSELLFRESALSLFPANMVYIIFLLAFGREYGVEGLTVAMVLGVALQILIQYPPLKRLGYHYSPRWDRKDPLLKRVLSMLPPILIGVLALEFNTIMDKVLASSLPVGSVSALQYGMSISSSIRMLFLTAVTTVMYPLISKSAQDENGEGELRGQIRQASRYMTLMSVPLTFFLSFLALPIIQAFFQHGAFSAEGAVMSSETLFFYAFAILPVSLVELYDQVFFARGNTKIPILNSLLLFGSNLAFNLLLIGPLKHAGLALGTSLSSLVSFIYLSFQIKKEAGYRLDKKEAKYFIKLVLTSLLVILIARWTYGWLDRVMPEIPIRSFINLVLAGALDFFISIPLWNLVGIEEVHGVMDLVKRKFKRKAPGKKAEGAKVGEEEKMEEGPKEDLPVRQEEEN